MMLLRPEAALGLPYIVGDILGNKSNIAYSLIKNGGL